MLVLVPTLYLMSGEGARFNDITGSTAPNAYSMDSNIPVTDVESIRLKTGNYTTTSNTSSPDGGDFVQYVEYIKTGGGSETINGKTFIVGNYFVPQIDGLSTASPDDWETTGYYVYPFNWVPTAAQVPLDISIAQLNQSGDTIEDNEYIYEYEVYDNDQTGTNAAVDGATYKVIGDENNSVTYEGNTYYGGEVFTAYSTSNIVGGANHYVTLYAAITGYAPLIYTITTNINDVIERQIGLGNQDLVNIPETQILKIRTKVEALQYSSETNNVSLRSAYDTITQISAVLSQMIIP